MSLEIYNKGSRLLTTKSPTGGEFGASPQIFDTDDIDGIKVIPTTVSGDDIDSGSFHQTNDQGMNVEEDFINDKGKADTREVRFNSARTHFHIYSGENLLYSKVQTPGDYIDYEIDNDDKNGYDFQLRVSPERDVRAANITKGSFTTVYNFLDQFTDKLRVDDILFTNSTQLQSLLMLKVSFLLLGLIAISIIALTTSSTCTYVETASLLPIKKKYPELTNFVNL